MILCAGEALIDMLPRETAAGERAFAPKAGGSVFNTAIALGRLGSKAGFFSGLSNDLFGQLLDETLHASNVSTALAARSDRPTTLAFVTLTDRRNRRRNRLFLWWNIASDRALRCRLPRDDARLRTPMRHHAGPEHSPVLHQG